MRSVPPHATALRPCGREAIILKPTIRSTLHSDLFRIPQPLPSVLFIRIMRIFAFLKARAVVAQEVIIQIHKRPIWCALFNVEVNNMRIICDQCDLPISGTVKKLFGNFNLHPHCLTRFAEGSTTPNPSTLPQQSSIAALVKWEQNAFVSSLELVKA